MGVPIKNGIDAINNLSILAVTKRNNGLKMTIKIHKETLLAFLNRSTTGIS